MKDRTALIKKKLHKTFSSIRGRILLITISLILLISIIITFISYFLLQVVGDQKIADKGHDRGQRSEDD